MLGQKLFVSILVVLIFPFTGGCDPVLEQRQRDGLQIEPFAPREYIRIRRPEDSPQVEPIE